MKMPVVIDSSNKNIDATLCGPVFVASKHTGKNPRTVFAVMGLNLDGSINNDPIEIMTTEQILDLSQIEFNICNKSEFVTAMSIKHNGMGVNVLIDDATKTVKYTSFDDVCKHIIQMNIFNNQVHTREEYIYW